MTDSAYNALTAAEVLDLVTNVFGLNGAHAAKKQKMAQAEIIEAAHYLWYKRPWPWRLVSDYEVTTTADTSYVALPSDCGQVQADRLTFDGANLYYIQGVKPLFWQETLRGYNGTGRPEYFTIRHRLIGTTHTPCVDFAPTPDAVYTITGLQYYRRMAAVDFSASTTIFPYAEFDMLWKDLAVKRIAALGFEPITQGFRLMTKQEVAETLAICESAWSPDVVNETKRVGDDYYGDSDLMTSGDDLYGL